MIRLLLVLCVGLGIGYTYGYLNGDAGDDSLIDISLERVGVHHALSALRGSAERLSREEAHRQATIDSIRQARIDSITSAIHH